MGNISDTFLVPGVYITLDNSLANTAQGESFKTVLVGQRTSTGTVAADTLTRVFSATDAHEKFGKGSMLAVMFGQWFNTNRTSEVYAVALDDDAISGTTSGGSITISGTATAAGTLYAYVNGNRYALPVATGDVAISIAVALADLINADVNAPYTASDVLNEVQISAKNKGTVANSFVIKTNYAEGEEYPAGISASVTPFSGGTNDPSIADAIAAIPDNIYNLIVNPYTDATNLGLLKTELERRWENTVQLDGHALHAFGGTASAVATKGDALNSQHFTFIDSGKDTLQPPMYWAANMAGRVAYSADVDPARPFRTLTLSGIIGDKPSDQRNMTELASILSSGIGIHSVANDGTVSIGRLVTTYKTNALGAADTSYQNTNTMLNLSKIRQAYKNRMLSRFPRHKLADDGTTFGAGQPIATPSVIKGEIIALYEELALDGLVEDVETFASTLSVTRDATNRSKVNVVVQPILMGQLYQFDMEMQFIV